MTLRKIIETRLGKVINALMPEEVQSEEVSEIQIMGESMSIAIFIVSILLSTISTVDYWLYNSARNHVDAIFVFFLTIIAAAIIWLFNLCLNVFFINNIKIKDRLHEYILKLFISTLFAAILMSIWYYFDVSFNIEVESGDVTMPKLILRGMYITLFANTSIWATESSISMSRQTKMLTQLKEENFEARYEILKQQVNPHFLFNSLNILKGMIRTKNENAEEFLIKLAEVYRYVLQANMNHEVAISEELNILNAYNFMLVNRFRDAIVLNVKLSPKAEKAIVPSLIFQLLMENCVKHNILTSSKKLYVKVYELDDYIYFENNIQLKNATETSNSVGLKNLIQRYKYLTEKEVQIIKNDQFFIVKMPLVFKN